MRCGVSTACFYPQGTAESLRKVCKAGVETTEIFLNTFSELDPAYIDRLRAILGESKTRVRSLHPFASNLDTFFFASEYVGRLEDGLRLYRRFFEICSLLKIRLMVFHGDYRQTPYPFEKYCENYLLLRNMARSYDVDFCQENVVRCKCGQPEYIRRMRECTRDDISFVLDVKQQRRAGVPLWEMMDAMRGKIAHVHLSGETPENDCVTPDISNFPLEAFLRRLAGDGFTGDIMIELYRGGFSADKELFDVAEKISMMAEKTVREGV